MPPRRGRGTQRGKTGGPRRGRSVSVADGDAGASAVGKQICNSCSVEVTDGCIGCDRCESWVHGTEMCAGLPMKVIEVILEHNGQGISYFCLKCRVARATELERSPSNQRENLPAGTLAQIFQQIQGLCAAVVELTAQVKGISSPPPAQTSAAQQPTPGTNPGSHSGTQAQSQNTNTPQTPQTTEYRQIVRQELREMHEREKRKDSVVIRGLRATTPRGISTEFGELTLKMMGTRVELSDIVHIPGHAGLCRGKILNDTNRKLVLDRAKTLKGTEYDGVFIRKDLTYDQRCVLKARREAYQTQRNDQNRLAPTGGAGGSSGTGAPAPFPRDSSNAEATAHPPSAGPNRAGEPAAPLPAGHDRVGEAVTPPHAGPDQAGGTVVPPPTGNDQVEGAAAPPPAGADRLEGAVGGTAAAVPDSDQAVTPPNRNANGGTLQSN